VIALPPDAGSVDPSPRCAHCGEPVPRGLVDPAAERQFCCGGCRAIWQSLQACGLGEYYAILGREQAHAPRPSAARSLVHLDGEEFLGRHARAAGPDRLAIEMRLDGLRCGACLWLLEALPRLEPGLASLRVNLARGTARIEWSPSITRLSVVASRLESLGYALAPLGDHRRREDERRQDRAWLVRLGVAGAIASNAMAIAFALYGGIFSGMDPAMRTFLHSTSVALAAASVLGPGWLFLANAAAAIRARSPHVDLPIAAALVAGLLGGAGATILGEGGVYAESVCMLVFLLLAGRFVQFRQQRAARHEIEVLCTLVPSTARRVAASGEVEVVATEALRRGDRVEVPSGESLPADGVLLEGPQWLDLAVLTGESRPVRVERGGGVFAGSRATDRSILLEVTARGDETRAASIARLVEEASSRRAPVVELANRIGGWFLAAVLVAAALNAAWWAPQGLAVALERTVALLIVTCPCALGLATPLAITASLAKAARRGILVRGGDVLERLARPGTVVLDKTGTITLGRTAVLRVEGDASALAFAAPLEGASVHPVARAIVAASGAARAPTRRVEAREVAGQGIEGVVDDHHVAVGRESFVADAAGMAGSRGASLAGWRDAAARLVAEGMSPSWIAIDGEVRAVVGTGDPLRQDSRPLVESLRARGWQVRLLSGDHPGIAVAVGVAAGIDPTSCRGGASPEAKAAAVSDPSLPRPVVMVGDGVNDLAAMGAADVGVAVREGAQAALATADVCLAKAGLSPLVELLDGARRTARTIQVNFAISLAYNLAGAALAVAGLVNPLVAAILMPVSGLTVTAVALRMPRFGGRSAAPGSAATGVARSRSGAGDPFVASSARLVEAR